MRILVIPHNHWVGYHVVTKLLDEGCQVEGIRDARNDTGLEDFFGRNSHFREIDQAVNHYELAIVIDDSATKNIKENAEKIFHIQTDTSLKIVPDNMNTSVISVPYLIGEGMEINETGLVMDGRLIPYTDKDWENNAIYITDFLNVLIQWIKMTHLPKLIEVTSVNNNLTNTKVEKKQVLLENRNIKEAIKTIKTFNKRFL
ncbi:NAD(P)-dependent oxidoreductase [Oceanobacillus sojae]|uniref:NAD(P)-dependent oxidoreductase n=1 Tax=Oceanobacillus sojae TaxID=582851 RepID=UPI0009886C61|nr:NAD(P)-dependent oxidoreductase [Oceanobacillus sojae]